MPIIYTGGTGTPLKDIIKTVQDKYNLPNNLTINIMTRCKWTSNGIKYDELCGYCHFSNARLIPGDCDSYSFDDLYDEYEFSDDGEDGEMWLTVWEIGDVGCC